MDPYIKTSLSPGSGVVTYYLKESGVVEYLEKLGSVGEGYYRVLVLEVRMVDVVVVVLVVVVMMMVVVLVVVMVVLVVVVVTVAAMMAMVVAVVEVMVVVVLVVTINL